MIDWYERRRIAFATLSESEIVNAEELYELWQAYRLHHPEVYREFIAKTFVKIRQGFQIYSADGIMHVVRFETNVNPNYADDYKITNNHVAFYSRLFLEDHPKHEGIFRLKISSADLFFPSPL